MSDRRVPRFDTYAAGTAVDDYSAELPIWPPRGGPTADCRLPIAGETVSSRGDPALPAAPSVRPQPGGAAFCPDAAALSSPARREEAGAPTVAPIRDAPAFALSERVALLLGVIAAYHRESREAALLRALAHYAEHTIGIAALARPMILPCDRGESLGADAQAPP